MNIGTCYFPSRNSAIHYYKSQLFDAIEVDRKIAEGEIIIGKPPVNRDQFLLVNKEGRYVLCEKEKGEKGDLLDS